MKTRMMCMLLTLLLVCPAQASHEWQPVPNNPSCLALVVDGQQKGVWYPLTNIYREKLSDGQWGPPTHAPVPTPQRNFGLEVSQIKKGTHYSLNGQTVNRQQIEQVLQESGVKSSEDPKIPDDASKRRITVIGTPEQTGPILEDWAQHASLAPYRESYLIAAYEPTFWAIQRQGFYTGGSPTLYIQEKDGRVLHRQDDYGGGAEELARILRQIDPEYRPEKDRDWRKNLMLHFFTGKVPWSIPVVVMVFVLILLVSRRSK